VKLKAMKIPYTKHPLLRPPTVNIGTIKGGDKVNMVSDYCEFTVDLRFPPGTKDRDVMSLVKRAVASEAKKFEIVVDDLQQPYTIDPKHPFVKAYVDTAKKMKTTVTLEGSQGATVISFFPKHKIPAFATGYGSRGTAHTTDEYCEVEKIYKGAKLLEEYLKVYDKI
jgi:acetylornithine deacetylase/succinyl-diaminopimelate desuccinylase-like protein